MEKILLILILSFQFLVKINCKLILKLEDTQIDITSLTKCNNKEDNYFVTVENVSIKNEHSEYLIYGTLITTVDISAPLKAIVKVERDELGIWLPIPCVDNIGSCTYQDLCVHGIPKNSTCPPEYIKSGVPCRCPIPKGVYTLKQIKQNVGAGNVMTGNYYAKIILQYENMTLSCYEVYFSLVATSKDSNENKVPFVEVV